MPRDRDIFSFVVDRTRPDVRPASDARGTGSDLPPLPEHSIVRTLCDLTEEDYTVPKGSIGTIVYVMADGIYDVEFNEPKNVVVAADRSELAPA